MTEENQPPKKKLCNGMRWPHKWKPVPADPAVVKMAKDDWLTGNYNTLQLSEKYKIARNSLVAFSRFYWLKEAKALGITPANEPPLARKRYGRQMWENARLDYLAGQLSNSEICQKYGIPQHYFEWSATKRGWIKERRSMYDEGKKLIQQSVTSKAGAMAERYDSFFQVVIDQIDVLTEKLKTSINEGTCSPDRLKTLVDTLGGIVTTGMKIYGVEKPATQVNNQFIRLNVLDDSAAATMNQLAKTIDLKAS